MCVMAMAAQADIVSAPYITGEFNGWNNGAILMNDAGSGIWEYTVSGLNAGQYQQFKVTDGTCSVAALNANSWYNADVSGEVKITFNTNVVSDGWVTEQFRVGVSTEPGT